MILDQNFYRTFFFLFLTFIYLGSFKAQVVFIDEGFEDSSFPPSGWQRINISGSEQWNRTTLRKSAGSASAFIRYQSDGGEDWLISPQVTIGSNPTLSFKVQKNYTTNYPPDYLYIKVSTTTDAISSFGSALQTIDVNSLSRANWTTYTVDLSGYNGQNIYIAFHHEDDDGNGVYMDEVTLGDAENTWNGSSWSTGSAPSVGQDVTINSSTSPGSFSATNVTLNDGIDLATVAGDTITISGNLSGKPKTNSLDANLQNFALNGSSSNWVNGAGGTFTGTGAPANGLNFDGSDDYVSIEDDPAFDFSTGLTIEAWVKADALINHASLVSKFANNEREFSILLLNTGSVEYSITFNGSTEQYFSGNTALSTGNWYHVALTYDGSNMRCYLNGVADGSNGTSGAIHNGSSDLYIGVRSEGSLSRYFDGTIDEVRIWKTVRSQTEIQNSMNNELSGNESGLVAYYNFNQGTAGNDNTGLSTLVDTAIHSYDPNLISGGGTLIFDNSGGTINLDNVKIDMEGAIEVTSGTTLQTNDSLTLTASSISSYGQIIGDGTVLGNVTSQAWLDVSTARYHYLGAPFTDATLEEFNEGQTMVAANSNQGTVWYWDADNASWAAPSALTDVAANGKGYAIYAGTSSYGTFLRNGNGPSQLDGTIASGDIAVPLGYNNGQASAVSFAGGTSQSATEGWNLLANPYPSQYDWGGQTLPSGTNNAFYINQGGSFASYVSGVGTNGGTQYLAPFQGFWVQTSNTTPGNFTFEQDQRVTAPSTSLKKTSSVDGVWLGLSDSLSADELFIGFDNNANIGFDANLDARKLLNEPSPNLFTSFNGDAYSICRVAPNSLSSFPLSLTRLTDGALYSFRLNHDLLQAYSSVSLEDKMLNHTHDLKSADYTFSENSSYGPGRFVLHFANGSVGENEFETSNIYAYPTENGLQLELGAIEDALVEVYGMSGKKIYTERSVTHNTFIPTKQNGIYIIHVTHNGHSKILKALK